jgi:hypothetical protein
MTFQMALEGEDALLYTVPHLTTDVKRAHPTWLMLRAYACTLLHYMSDGTVHGSGGPITGRATLREAAAVKGETPAEGKSSSASASKWLRVAQADWVEWPTPAFLGTQLIALALALHTMSRDLMAWSNAEEAQRVVDAWSSGRRADPSDVRSCLEAWSVMGRSDETRAVGRGFGLEGIVQLALHLCRVSRDTDVDALDVTSAAEESGEVQAWIDAATSSLHPLKDGPTLRWTHAILRESGKEAAGEWWEVGVRAWEGLQERWRRHVKDGRALFNDGVHDKTWVALDVLTSIGTRLGRSLNAHGHTDVAARLHNGVALFGSRRVSDDVLVRALARVSAGDDMVRAHAHDVRCVVPSHVTLRINSTSGRDETQEVLGGQATAFICDRRHGIWSLLSAEEHHRAAGSAGEPHTYDSDWKTMLDAASRMGGSDRATTVGLEHLMQGLDLVDGSARNIKSLSFPEWWRTGGKLSDVWAHHAFWVEDDRGRGSILMAVVPSTSSVRSNSLVHVPHELRRVDELMEKHADAVYTPDAWRNGVVWSLLLKHENKEEAGGGGGGDEHDARPATRLPPWEEGSVDTTMMALAEGSRSWSWMIPDMSITIPWSVLAAMVAAPYPMRRAWLRWVDALDVTDPTSALTDVVKGVDAWMLKGWTLPERDVSCVVRSYAHLDDSVLEYLCAVCLVYRSSKRALVGERIAEGVLAGATEWVYCAEQEEWAPRAPKDKDARAQLWASVNGVYESVRAGRADDPSLRVLSDWVNHIADIQATTRKWLDTFHSIVASSVPYEE